MTDKKNKSFGDQRDSTEVKMLVLNVVSSDLIPGISSGPWARPEVILEQSQRASIDEVPNPNPRQWNSPSSKG